MEWISRSSEGGRVWFADLPVYFCIVLMASRWYCGYFFNIRSVDAMKVHGVLSSRRTRRS
jgi:hypothetical protein